jgi:ribonuclease P protein component
MVGRLKRRRDFLAAAKGQKAARRAFVLEARQRGDEEEPRFATASAGA